MIQNPYAAPVNDLASDALRDPPRAHGYLYRPFGARTALAASAIAGNVIVALGGAAFELSTPSQLSPSENSTVLVVEAARILSLVLAAIMFSIWVHRACANAWSLDIGTMRTTPGWAVGWFFVPIANLWKPFQTVNEIWMGSHRDWRPRDGLLLAWWGTWILSGVLGRIAAFTDSFTLDFVSEVVNAACGLLVILVMRTIAQRQEASSRDDDGTLAG